MSKFSITERYAQKKEQPYLEALKQEVSGPGDELTPKEIAALDPKLFVRVEYSQAEAEKVGYSDYSYWRGTLRMFLKNKAAICTLCILVVMILFTLIQPFLPGQMNPNLINNDPATGMQIINQRPNSHFWFGTNSIGQDLWSRLWAGTRTSLFIGLAVAVIQTVVGIGMGVLWGYVRKLDFFLTEFYNVLSNIPTTIILILASYILRPSVSTIILAMCVTGWMGMALFIRNQVLIVRDRDFNLASRCLGTPVRRIVFKNLLPQMVSIIMLRMSLAIPGAIGSEVFLTYIGLGLPLETPSLGNLVDQGRVMMMSPELRYQLIFPAVAVSIITICFYLCGNAFADAADPKNHT